MFVFLQMLDFYTLFSFFSGTFNECEGEILIQDFTEKKGEENTLHKILKDKYIEFQLKCLKFSNVLKFLVYLKEASKKLSF